MSLLSSAAGADAGREAATGECLRQALVERDRDLHRRYLYETNGRQGIRGYGGADSCESILIEGSRRLVILWHGFMASPPEMEPLGSYLHQRLGATVYIPLIPGFGSGHQVADKFGLPAWTTSVEEAIELGRRCSGRLALVGYSVGGGLVVDHLVRREAAADEIDAVVLLSPYIETAGWMMPGLGRRPRSGALRFLRSGVRLRSVGLKRVYGLSRSRYRDLEILLRDPAVYDQKFSLKAGVNMIQLTRRLRGAEGAGKIATPTLLALSESDRTVSWRFTEEFVRERFAAAEPVIRYPGADGIAHQIVVPEVNPRFEELAASVAAFLERRFEGPG